MLISCCQKVREAFMFPRVYLFSLFYFFLVCCLFLPLLYTTFLRTIVSLLFCRITRKQMRQTREFVFIFMSISLILLYSLLSFLKQLFCFVYVVVEQHAYVMEVVLVIWTAIVEMVEFNSCDSRSSSSDSHILDSCDLLVRNCIVYLSRWYCIYPHKQTCL